MAGKECEFSAKKAGKRLLFDEIWLEFQILYQWTLSQITHKITPIDLCKQKSNLLTFLSSSPTLKPYNWKNP